MIGRFLIDFGSSFDHSTLYPYNQPYIPTSPHSCSKLAPSLLPRTHRKRSHIRFTHSRFTHTLRGCIGSTKRWDSGKRCSESDFDVQRPDEWVNNRVQESFDLFYFFSDCHSDVWVSTRSKLAQKSYARLWQAFASRSRHERHRPLRKQTWANYYNDV